MDFNSKSEISCHQAFVQDEFILGDGEGEDEFISPDLESVIQKEEDVDIKDEPINFDDDCVIFDENEIKSEPQSPENKTDSIGKAEMPLYEFCTNSSDNDNSGQFIVGSVHPNDIRTVHACSTGMTYITSTNDLASTNESSVTNEDENNSGTILLSSHVQERLPSISGNQSDFGALNQDIHLLAFIARPPPPVLEVVPSLEEEVEEEVQVQVSNKWIESRGDNYVNLSILSGFPNPQVTKSISLTREGIQIFVHKLPLKTSHSIWNLLGSSTAIEKGQSLSTIANYVEKMKICSGCWDQKCRELWEEGRFRERGFIEAGFSPSPVYRTFACDLLIDSTSRSQACIECQREWTSMIRMLSKKRRSASESREIDQINYRFLTKVDMECALRESKKESSKYKKEIVMLHREIDALVNESRQMQDALCNKSPDEINH